MCDYFLFNLVRTKMSKKKLDTNFVAKLIQQASVITYELRKHDIPIDIILKIITFCFQECTASIANLFDVIDNMTLTNENCKKDIVERI